MENQSSKSKKPANPNSKTTKEKPANSNSKTTKEKPSNPNSKTPQKKTTNSNHRNKFSKSSANKNRRRTTYNNEETGRAQKGYREITRKYELPFEITGVGDEHFLFEGSDGRPKYEDVNEPWNHLIQWVETISEQIKESKGETREYRLGEKIIQFAKQHCAHHVYIMMSRYWVEFRDNYLLVEGCPEQIMEFVRGIMHEKMTEEQMWGTDEDRMPKGTLVVFDKKYLPAEGEDTGKLKVVYQPLEGDVDENEYLTEIKMWDGPFPFPGYR